MLKLKEISRVTDTATGAFTSEYISEHAQQKHFWELTIDKESMEYESISLFDTDGDIDPTLVNQVVERIFYGSSALISGRAYKRNGHHDDAVVQFQFVSGGRPVKIGDVYIVNCGDVEGGPRDCFHARVVYRRYGDLVEVASVYPVERLNGHYPLVTISLDRDADGFYSIVG